VTLVVDASVALKWFLVDEPLAAEALAVVQDNAALIAPDIVIAEVCNAAWRSARLGRINQDQGAKSRRFCHGFSTSCLAPHPWRRAR
jgi:predicted nucleic acid-binding protein